MSDLNSVLLLDPAPMQLAAALEQVAQHVNLSSRVHPPWLSLCARVSTTTEGHTRLPSALMAPLNSIRGFLHLAWWTDHRGSKLVQIRAGDTNKAQCAHHLSRLDEDPRPPLWHLCPDRVYRVKRGDASPRWLVSCACGITGLPHRLAWMGQRCGPCHDRREEGEPGLVLEPPTQLRQGNAVSDLAFDPAGKNLAVSSSSRTLSLLPTDGSPEQVCIEASTDADHTEFQPLVFSPDGAWLAMGDPMAGEPIFWPYLDDSRLGNFDQVIELPLGGEHADTILDMAFSHQSDQFAACDAYRRGRLFRKVGSHTWPEVCTLRGATALAFSADGQSLAVGGSGGAVRLFSTDRGRVTNIITTGARSDESVLFLSWQPHDNSLLLVTGSEVVSPLDDPQQLRRYDVRRGRETHRSDLPFSPFLGVSPDGRYLATVHHDDQHSPAAIHFRDLNTWEKVGWIESDPEEEIRAFAFSPDGQTLAIGTLRGQIKLIPYRLLLEA